jgi:integrase
MKISIYAKKKKDTPHRWVYLRVTTGTGQFLVSTEISCIHPPKGCQFPRQEQSHAVKSRTLMRIYTEAHEWGMQHPTASDDETRAALSEIATGKKKTRRQGNTLVDCIMTFLEKKEKRTTRIIYRTTANKLEAYDPVATLETIDRKWLERFEAHLRSEGCSTNYISIQLRNIRAVFNYAIDEGLTVNYPFRKYKIKQEKTEKRNLTAEQLRALRDLALDGYMAEYRDMFLLMFYLIGINAADLFTLSHGDYRDGRIHYRRSKTGTLYSVKVEPEAKAIIERYKGEKHLLCPLDRYNDHRDYLHHLNDALKRMGQTYRNGVGWSGEPLFPSLSSYWSRHTWATLAASLGVPLDVISLALGHSFGNRVTQIYIEWSLGKVDEANRRVIDLLNEKGAPE